MGITVVTLIFPEIKNCFAGKRKRRNKQSLIKLVVSSNPRRFEMKSEIDI